jgi:glutamyl-tRNA reductase
MIDLAVPRDIDSAVATLPGVQLYDLDHLQAVVDRNLAFRNGERDAVEAIVEEEVQKFAAWVRAHSVVPTISRLRMTAEKIRQAEVEKALRRLGPLGDQQREIIEVMTRGIINKLLHEPTVRLKEKAGDADGAEYEHVLSELFGLNSEGAAE